MKVKGLDGLANLRATLPDATTPTGSHAELEAAIAAEPDDAALYSVYGDALELTGDRRAALIAMHANGVDATAYVAEHGAYLLGGLVTRDDLDIDWFMGFIRRLAVTARSTSDALELLAVIADLPSTRFLRTLDIRGSVDARAIEERLVVLARPDTLSTIMLHAPRWVPSEPLRAAFPRLGRGDALAHVIEVARKSPRMTVTLDLAGLALDGPSVDIPLLVRALKIDFKSKPIGAVAALVAFTPASVTAFARALAASWRAAGHPPREAWVQDLLAAVDPIGPAAEIDGAPDHTIFFTTTQQQAQTVLAQLEPGSVSEICVLASYVLRPHRHARRESARRALTAIANREGMTVDELIASTPPSAIHHAIRPLVDDGQRAWFAELMRSGRRLEAAAFRTYVVEHPRRRALAAGIVFVQGDATFTLDEPYTLTDRSVGVAHPAMLDADTLARWRARGLAQPIGQLERPVFAATDAELASSTLTRFARFTPGLRRVLDTLEPRGWQVTHRFEGTGLPTTLAREVRDTTATIALGTRGTIDSVEVPRLAKLPRIAISELLYELDAAARGEDLVDLHHVEVD